MEHKAKHIIHYKERVECHLWVWDDILHHVNQSEHLWGQFKSDSSRELIGVASIVTHTSSLGILIHYCYLVAFNLLGEHIPTLTF